MDETRDQGKSALTLARISLVLTAMVFGGFGLTFLLWPEVLEITEVTLATPMAVTEIRAFYGGMELGFAIFFALAAARPSWFRPALVAQIGALGGLASGRIFGLIVDGSPDSLHFLLTGTEITGALIGGLALWRLTATSLADGDDVSTAST